MLIPYEQIYIPMTYSPPVSNLSIELAKHTLPSNSNSPDAVPCILKADSPPPKQPANLKDILVIILTAEASWHVSYDWCTAAYLRQAGVKTDHISLSNIGVHTKGHMMFLESNSDVIAGVVEGWLDSQ
jgi:hypothetical protein